MVHKYPKIKELYYVLVYTHTFFYREQFGNAHKIL